MKQKNRRKKTSEEHWVKKRKMELEPKNVHLIKTQ